MLARSKDLASGGEHTSEEFQKLMHDSLKDGGIFVGFLKPNCKTLFNGDGTPGRFTLEPGDVLDEIEEFRRACETGAYQATGERFNPGDDVHESPVTNH